MFNTYIFCISSLLLLSTCEGPVPSTSDPITLSGQVDISQAGEEIILAYFNPIDQSRTGIDTAVVNESGVFNLQFELPEPALLRLDLPKRKNCMLVLAPEDKNVQIMLDQAGEVKVFGSPSTDKLLAYDAFRRASLARLITPSYTAMREAKAAGDVASEVAAVAAYVNNSELHRKELLDFTAREIGTSPALFGTMLRWTGDDEVSRLDQLVSAFAAAHPNWAMTKVMQEKVDRYRKVAIGAIAPPLSAAGPDQITTVDLHENLGTVTLIDFWASWCGPCISQLPDLQAVHHEFADQGFNIFGLSVDNQADKWLAALEQHDMPWLHASDLKGWQSPQAAAYNVTFVPFNVLLDAEGRIVAKNLHAKELHDQVAALLE